MPKKSSFKFFKPCEVCGEPAGARSLKELEPKRFCSNKCRASVRKSKLSKSERMSVQVARQYKMMDGNPEKYIKHLLQRPDRKHLQVENLLDLLDKQGGVCALSGVKLTFIKVPGRSKVHTNLSIDRIDSTKGYDIDNIQLVAAIVNIMKSTLSVEELKQWCGAIIDHSKEVAYA